jgi:hypothetical protein
MSRFGSCLAALFLFAQVSAQVEIHPGDNIQNRVNQDPGQTTFLIKSGVHRLQRVNPKSGNVFKGEDGAVLCGARELTSWYESNGYWIHDGQDQQGSRRGACEEGYESCNYPEDLFMDDYFMEQVLNRNQVESGKWYFDYGANRIYMRDNPNGHKMEISVSDYAFEASSTNVTIRNLVVEKYANTYQSAAVRLGPGSLMEDCETRLNHASGIVLNGNAVVRRCNTHHNGQSGMGATGEGGVVEHNEMCYNCVKETRFDCGWDGGAQKFAYTRNLVVRSNYSHHNRGPGLWTDINNRGTLYEGNLVEYNDIGIFHEISYDATIKCNMVRNNGKNHFQWLWGAQIHIANSENVEVCYNIVDVHADYGNGIVVTRQDRGRWVPRNNLIHHNVVTFHGRRGLNGCDADDARYDFWTNGNNNYEENTYHVADPSYYYWAYAEPGYNDGMAPMLTWDKYQAMGQDLKGSVDGNVAGGSPDDCPECAEVLSGNRYLTMNAATKQAIVFSRIDRKASVRVRGRRVYVAVSRHGSVRVIMRDLLGRSVITMMLPEKHRGALSFPAPPAGLYVVAIESECRSVAAAEVSTVSILP